MITGNGESDDGGTEPDSGASASAPIHSSAESKESSSLQKASLQFEFFFVLRCRYEYRNGRTHNIYTAYCELCASKHSANGKECNRTDSYTNFNSHVETKYKTSEVSGNGSWLVLSSVKCVE